MKYELAKTQFLEPKHYEPVKAYRRRRGLMLFNKSGEPQRRIEDADWRKLKKDWPEEVKQDGLYVKTVWFLTEISR